MKSITKLAIGGFAMVLAAQASAETIRIDATYPAPNDRAAMLESIAIERFGGEDGPALSILIGDRLRDARIDGAPYFRVLPASLANDADAALRGTVSVRVDVSSSSDKEVSRCVKRDDNRNCVERRKEKIPCELASVSVRPTLRLIGIDGDLIHSDGTAASRQVRYCADQDQPSLDPLVNEALREIADRMRADLAPTQRSDLFRIMESRKRMDRQAAKAFRAAVKLTKRDVAGACNAFEDLEGVIGDQVSLLFNIGLCAEFEEDFARARNYYQRSLDVDASKGYAAQGLYRLERRKRAGQQLEARFGAL